MTVRESSNVVSIDMSVGLGHRLHSVCFALQAVRSGNPSQLQQAQLNIAQRRAGIRTPIGATPAGFGTPGASLLRTPGLGMTPVAGTPSMTPRLGVNTGKYRPSSLVTLYTGRLTQLVPVSAASPSHVPALSCCHGGY